MSQPINLDKFRKKRRTEKANGKTLCSRGFHKWVDEPKKQFDVKRGKLVSMQKCRRCGVTRSIVS